MRRNSLSKATKDEEQQIDLTPMLDVVFIMLIFFIVTAQFVKEPGVDIERPAALTAISKDNANILIGVSKENQIWMDKKTVEEDALRLTIERMLVDNPDSQVVIQADATSDVRLLALVQDAAKEAGAVDISVSTLHN
ncbi:ExbD/TolR family protein [Umboniibacter marinipuniceus]|uniref:Outer membrane transport energization protein ExbD n=1 Tax=Umboniibacter marinipuniceus TaxID=569599 RepID=A0A3M0ACM3_9GAMM|nr:biopolymer transporter ExbD [Umboniibacter marinipuniceus]RMA80205.1 outer membrane transport energization protein ExbD [Umboniibacter marinipuniceus]